MHAAPRYDSALGAIRRIATGREDVLVSTRHESCDVNTLGR